MIAEMKPIDYRNMTWKQVFETIQYNMGQLYDTIVENQTSLEIEQFDGGVSSITISTPVDDKTEWLVFRNDYFLGKREGGEGYTVDGQIITFDTELEDDESATVMVISGDTLSILANKYVAEIKEMYDSLSDLDIDITRQIEVVTSMKNMLDESAYDIFDAKRICGAYKDYIEQLLSGTVPSQGEFADEIVAARGGYPLIGARLDKFVSTAYEKQTFLDSTNYKDGDWVFVKDGNAVYLYMVYDEYTGTLPHIPMTHGQTAVILMSLEDYADISALENQVDRLAQIIESQERTISSLTSRVEALEQRLEE